MRIRDTIRLFRPPVQHPITSSLLPSSSSVVYSSETIVRTQHTHYYSAITASSLLQVCSLAESGSESFPDLSR